MINKLYTCNDKIKMHTFYKHIFGFMLPEMFYYQNQTVFLVKLCFLYM